MVLKYRNKKYSSEDVPLFLYFKNESSKEDFINILVSYTPNTFVRLDCIEFAIAGNTVIKDKRSGLYINLETMEEKKDIQRYVYNSTDESNAVISSPPDIRPVILEEWICKHTKNLILS